MSYELELRFKAAHRAAIINALQRFDPDMHHAHGYMENESATEASEGMLNRIFSALVLPVINALEGPLTEFTPVEFPIQISISRNSASVDIYSTADETEAESAFRRFWSYLKIADAAAPLTIFDSQQQKNIDLQVDYESTLQSYLRFTQAVRNLADRIQNQSELPRIAERPFHDQTMKLEGVISGTDPVLGVGKLDGMPFCFRAQHTGWKYIISVDGNADPSTIDSILAKDGFFKDGDKYCYIKQGYYGPGETAGQMNNSTAERLIRDCSGEFLKRHR